MLGLLKINSSIYSIFETQNTTSNIANYYAFCMGFFFQNNTYNARTLCNQLILLGYYPDDNELISMGFVYGSVVI